MSESDIQRWMRFAAEDLLAAERMLCDLAFAPRLVCLFAQQAAEKALKAALLAARVAFPKTHDLDALQALLPADWPVKRPLFDLSELSEWAVESRYPGGWPEATTGDAQPAAALAGRLVRAVEAELGKRAML